MITQELRNPASSSSFHLPQMQLNLAALYLQITDHARCEIVSSEQRFHPRCRCCCQVHRNSSDLKISTHFLLRGSQLDCLRCRNSFSRFIRFYRVKSTAATPVVLWWRNASQLRGLLRTGHPRTGALLGLRTGGGIAAPFWIARGYFHSLRI